jgi:hypothetical protein
LITETEPPDEPRPPTGRAVKHRKLRVEECYSLDLTDLRRAGLFDSPLGQIWMNLQERGRYGPFKVFYSLLDSTSGARFLALIYKRPGSEKLFAYSVRLDWTPCPFGGGRWWFRCPIILDGQPCRRRRRILYRPPSASYFGCRECYRLTYRVRQWHRKSNWEGYLRPLELLEEELRKPIATLTPPQQIRRVRQFRQAAEAAKRYPEILRRQLGLA